MPINDIFALLKDHCKANPEEKEIVESTEKEIKEAAGVLAAVSLYILATPNYSMLIDVPTAEAAVRRFRISVEEVKA